MRRVLLVCGLIALVLPLTALAEPPVVTVPPDMTVEAQNFSGATVTYAASAVDDHGRPITINCSPGSGTIFAFGTTTVTCWARSGGDTVTKRFKVTVVDRTPPSITVPTPPQLTTRVRTGKAYTFTASAADLVDGAVAVSCTPVSGAVFPVGTTGVTCSAADLRGNAASASFNVTVVLLKKRSKKSSVMLAPAPGARVTAPPLLRWRGPRTATFFNAQVYRHGRKVLSAWPTRARLQLHKQWTFAGRTYRLKPGPYTWIVWPAYGSAAKPRYGKMLGQSTFLYAH
jgi:hypothetical protein